MSVFDGLPEDFLHQVWDQRYYAHQGLRTLTGQTLEIIYPGRWNRDQGPDFLEAHVRIGGLDWFGQIELHLHSRDWYRHGHQNDPVYNATVLHVVLEGGQLPIQRADGSTIPELVLGPSVDQRFIAGYRQHCQTAASLPCAPHWPHLETDIFPQWLPTLIRERLETKAARLGDRLHVLTQDWAQVVWESVMRYMGGPVNGAAFAQLAERVPIATLRRYRGQRMALEAWLLGGAGLLTGSLPRVAYAQALLPQWHFLQQKHALPAWTPVPLYHHRMRPPGFPARRLSQMADWLTRQSGWVDLLAPAGWQTWLTQPIQAHPYWQTHHGWDRPSRRSWSGRLTEDLRDRLLSNVFLPLSMCYFAAHGRAFPLDEVMEALSHRPAENNRIIRRFVQSPFKVHTLLEGQALLHLHKEYCLPKHCLRCRVGQSILQPGPDQVSEPLPGEAAIT